jgi:murein DD-endopeptidase MepM/ murein hydrolase activator NlpD
MPVQPLPDKKLPPNANTSFGARRSGDRPPECGGGHCGVDLYYWKSGLDKNTGIGKPVYSVAAGKVVAANTSSSAGVYVWIDHGSFRSHYVHLNERYVSTGDQVKEGQTIGTLGRSGIKTDPAHLHFGLSMGGKYFDPVPSLKQWPVAAGGLGMLLLVAGAAYWYFKVR